MRNIGERVEVSFSGEVISISKDIWREGKFVYEVELIFANGRKKTITVPEEVIVKQEREVGQDHPDQRTFEFNEN